MTGVIAAFVGLAVFAWIAGPVELAAQSMRGSISSSSMPMMPGTRTELTPHDTTGPFYLEGTVRMAETAHRFVGFCHLKGFSGLHGIYTILWDEKP